MFSDLDSNSFTIDDTRHCSDQNGKGGFKRCLKNRFLFHNCFYCISLSRCDCFTSSGASRENCTVCRIKIVDHPLPRFNKKERLITQVLSTQVILCSPRIQPCGDQFAVIEQIVTLFTSRLFANCLHTPSKQDRCSKSR